MKKQFCEEHQCRADTCKQKHKKAPRYPDYERVIMPDVVTFGTTVFMRKDKRALLVVFPAGQEMIFAPEDEIAEGKLKELNLLSKQDGK